MDLLQGGLAQKGVYLPGGCNCRGGVYLLGGGTCKLCLRAVIIYNWRYNKDIVVDVGVGICYQISNLVARFVPVSVFKTLTRLHSSRMGTVCCSDRLGWRGVVSARGCIRGRVSARWCLPMGVSAREWVSAGGVSARGVCLRGCTPPFCGQNSWHKLVKILPSRNFVCER